MKKRVILAFIATGFLLLLSSSIASAAENCSNIKKFDWFIEVDIKDNAASECTIKYTGGESKIDVNEDMTLAGNTGSCLDRANNNYWLEISGNCLDKEFTISCDKDFISALIYREGTSGPVYVSSEAHSGAAGASTKEKASCEAKITPTPTPTDTTSAIYCESAGYVCAEREECLGSDGQVLDRYECERDLACCSLKPVETCEKKGGEICDADQECEERISFTMEGECCRACVNKRKPIIENECVDKDIGTCRNSCEDGEEEKLDINCAESSDVCCAGKEEGGYLVWIIILLALIGLVILGIINRHKIQIWLHNRKQGKGSVPRSGGGMPPRIMPTQMPSRYMPPPKRGPAPRMTRGPKSASEKEMEETMRKLKEMSK